MATAAALHALEAECPWLLPAFRADLASLKDSTARAAQQFAADMRVLAGLVAQVPRSAFDERGATPWTSFRREVAVARSLSDTAAAAEIRAAVRLTTAMPCTLALLDAGRMTVQRARALVREVESYDDDLVLRLDAELAERVAGLPLWRITQEVRRAVAVQDPDAAASRAAAKNAGRGTMLIPDADDQASVVLYGPAVPLTRWYGSLEERARALKQAGDPRTLDNLRFDLAISTFPCAAHPPADPTASPADRSSRDRGAEPPAAGGELRDTGSGRSDCRQSRPVQANVVVPVESALGLSNEPAWLDGYGWISAPATRQLLVDAELRRVCTRVGTGELVDLAARDVRPPPTPQGVRQALLDMVLGEIELHSTAWRVEHEHDPSPPLRELVALRDRFCDGPTGTRSRARHRDLDHDLAHPQGPTAAWNLVARSQRTHQLKHHGWTPLRTPTSTLWFSPAGQLVEVPRHLGPAPGADGGPAAVLPDPDALATVDAFQLQAPDDDLSAPWLPAAEQVQPQRVWLDEPAF